MINSQQRSPAPRPRFKQVSAMQANQYLHPNHHQQSAGRGFSSADYATGLLHVALCGSAGWAMHEVDYEQLPFAFGCFSFLFGHSLLGILRFTHPDVQKFVHSLYRHSQLLAQACPLALMTGQLSRQFKEPHCLAHFYAAIAFVPTICEILLPERNERALDLVVLGTATSLGYMSLMRDRYWSMGLAVLATVNHFGHRLVADSFEMSRTDLITFGLGFFVIFGVNALFET